MPDRVLLHLADGDYEAVDLADVYYVESARHDTWVRLRGRRRRKDVRQLGELERKLKSRGFMRVHRSYLVNLGRVRFLRKRKNDDGWELRLEPPVNAVLPVGRDRVRTLVSKLG
jgi:DNA-binding LytR/AlgR family response regulator